jgi:ketosteroid isomerase-like protein
MKKIIAVGFAFTMIGCNPQKPDLKAEGEKIMELSREWSRAASSGNVEKTVSYWAEDAMLMSAGQP